MSSRKIVYHSPNREPKTPETSKWSSQHHHTPSSSSRQVGLLSPAVEKLYKVKESLTSLNGDIKDDLERNREMSQSKFYEVREMAAKVEKQLTQEMKKRAESDRVLQTMFDNKLNAIQDIFEKKISERYSQLQITIDMLTKRVATLEKQLTEEKDKNAMISQDIRVNFLNQLDELKNVVESERVARLEKEAHILKQQAEDIMRCSERIENEKNTRDQQVADIKDEIQQSSRDRSKQHEHFKQQVVEDMDILKQALKAESKQREQTEEQMVTMIDSIVSEIQQSLRTVAK